TITAVSVADPAQTASAVVSLLAQPLSGTIWYVATDGSDANPGTISAPFATLQHAAKVAVAGDTVLARAGVYNQLLTLTKSGSAAEPITFRSYPGEAATLDGTGLPIPGGQNGLITIHGASDLIVEGFELRNYTTDSNKRVPLGVYIYGAGDGLQIVNNHIHDIATTAKTTPKKCGSDAFGMTVYGTKAPAAISNLAVAGNEFDHLQTGCSETLSLDGNVDGFLIANNLVHDDNNIGIGAIGFEKVSPDPAYDQARNGEIRGNVVYNITSFGNPDYGKQYAADGIYVDGGTEITIEQNRVHNVDLGIELASEHKDHVTSLVTARNNVIYADNSNGISIGGYGRARGGTDQCIVVNNTLYGNDTKNTGSGELQIQWYATNNVIVNNIAYGGAQNLLLHNFTRSEPLPAMLNDNLYNLAAGAANALFVWERTHFRGFTNYQTSTGEDLNSIFSDPLFANVAAQNFDIDGTSPAIGAGATLSSDVIGTADFAGNPRIGANGLITIGAYQNPAPHAREPRT
ncbi:MAG TPA: right-handed parallel beta-helix repeat-containing protein, partial [Acetobacteraceae bacterium]|nr:right-handed parallel beta-helix repeat-containing protein [Acetobacteraceae bacterium]